MRLLLWLEALAWAACTCYVGVWATVRFVTWWRSTFRRIPERGRCPGCGNRTYRKIRLVRLDQPAGVYLRVECTLCFTAWYEDPVSVPRLPAE